MGFPPNLSKPKLLSWFKGKEDDDRKLERFFGILVCDRACHFCEMIVEYSVEICS